MGWYNRYLNWAQRFEELHVLPVNELALAMFLLSLHQQGNAPSTIKQCVSAINWIHHLSGLAKPSDYPMIKTITEGCSRAAGTHTTRKEPITAEILQKLKGQMEATQNPMHLMDKRLFTYALVSYAGFLRFDEAAHLRCSDITFSTSHVPLFIERSKTDVYRNGRTVLLARTGTVICPVKCLLEYRKVSKYNRTFVRFQNT